MKVAIGSDHAGFELKKILLDELKNAGHEPVDLGAYDEQPSDYPDFAEKVGLSVKDGETERGILICGSGVGASVAANKIPGIRAGNVTDTYSAHQGVEHDQMNVLVLGSRVIGSSVAKELVKAFLGAEFSGDERHVKRLAKVAAIEKRDLEGKE
ncbi:MAG: ribose 5-phosphate isomerase B [Armatimonadetes bacterium 55-13]|nr:ribose 5-phosphate isomerase B [Armatimonadota bacterium]ODU52479.1 MAG: ribose 5-phosphate isomerase B [bacterium SCN 57-13]OJU63859.1 MAG: ribose 5-phosphate isomerase B [Armatimonadetes bacterium 55-13]